MADFKLELLVQVALNQESTVLYTVPNGKTCIITECILCNTSPNDVNIYQSFVKRAEGLSTKNTIIKDLTLKPNETYRMTFSTFLAPYTTIRMHATEENVVSCQISGVLI
jgi:hypothetical protein